MQVSAEEVNQLRNELAQVHASIDMHASAIRDINNRLLAARSGAISIPQAELPDLLETLQQHGDQTKSLNRRGQEIYERLKSLGFSTRQLDERYSAIPGTAG
jgi:predicted RNA-binding Zn ribbon-like protein